MTCTGFGIQLAVTQQQGSESGTEEQALTWLDSSVMRSVMSPPTVAIAVWVWLAAWLVAVITLVTPSVTWSLTLSLAVVTAVMVLVMPTVISVVVLLLMSSLSLEAFWNRTNWLWAMAREFS